MAARWQLGFLDDAMYLVALGEPPPDATRRIDGWLAVRELERWMALSDDSSVWTTMMDIYAFDHPLGVGQLTEDRTQAVRARVEDALLSGRLRAFRRAPFAPPGEPSAVEEQPPGRPKAATTSWIEIELVDMEGNPVPGEAYQLTLPDRTVIRGVLDEHGFALVAVERRGTCKLTFPDLDGEAWEEV